MKWTWLDLVYMMYFTVNPFNKIWLFCETEPLCFDSGPRGKILNIVPIHINTYFFVYFSFEAGSRSERSIQHVTRILRIRPRIWWLCGKCLIHSALWMLQSVKLWIVPVMMGPIEISGMMCSSEMIRAASRWDLPITSSLLLLIKTLQSQLLLVSNTPPPQQCYYGQGDLISVNHLLYNMDITPLWRPWPEEDRSTGNKAAGLPSLCLRPLWAH